MRAKQSVLLLVGFFLALSSASAAGDADGPLGLSDADTRLAIAERLIQGGIYPRASELALSVLDDPAARAREGSPEDTLAWRQRREFGRFLLDRARLGMAETRDQILDAAGSLVQLANNRYRLPEPAFAVQAAYWAGRAYEQAGEYQFAADQYSRVGGLTLPQGMEGDAAQRLSRCLRRMAEEIPYPGGVGDRRRREQLLNQAIGELDRARTAFPVGNRRKEIELDLISLRLARREEQFVREAATEAEAFIEGDPARTELRARAVLYRGRAAAALGDPRTAADWFGRVIGQEAPDDADRRSAQLGLGLALIEMADAADAGYRKRLLDQATESLDGALEGVMSPGPWDGARIVKAELLLELNQPSAVLETLRPILEGNRVNPRAWRLAGRAELARGRLGEALARLYPATRPSNPGRELRYAASREGARTAELRRDYGMALALNHQASRMLRRDLLFSTLLVSEFQALEIILELGKAGGPASLSGDLDLLTAGREVPIAATGARRGEAADELAGALGRVLTGGGDPDRGYDLAVAAESAHEWSGDGGIKLELAIAMISHLRKRQPAGVTDSVLYSRLGQARQTLALNRAETALAADAPDTALIDRVLGDFAAAAASFQEASAAGGGRQDNLEQGMVNLESGAFLLRLADKWEHGQWSGNSLAWREEARLRIEASLRPFNQAIATSGTSSQTSQRSKWARGRALELLGEWRGAAADYLSLMNNSELPRMLRANAARRWARSLGELGESRQALTRLAVFADSDAEAALLAGKLAEAAGLNREAYQRYLFAADPDAPALPPATPWRRQEAAYRAAGLALSAPAEVNPLVSRETTRDEATLLLERNALERLEGAWTIPMLELLGESRIASGPDGWRRARDLAISVLEKPGADPALGRSMHLLAAKAMAAGGNYPQALDELDAARELVGTGAVARLDAARLTLETARIYRLQGRDTDALRAYADVFATYPEAIDSAEAARVEAVQTIFARPDTGEREREQARNILSGLRDQLRAERIMREHGIH